MAKEIEAKMKVDDFAAVRDHLIAGGAERKRTDLETNTFFDTPDGALVKKDSGLRIRVAIDERGAQRCTITMKGALEKGQFKTREETQFTADDPKAVQKLFENLGYHPTLSFQKKRESWNFQDCEVELDELPLLGKFVEIEGPTEAKVTAAREALKLNQLPLISTGYISMLSKYLCDHGIKNNRLTF